MTHPSIDSIEHGIGSLQMVEYKLSRTCTFAQQAMMFPVTVVGEQTFKECVIVGVGVDSFLIQ